MNLLSRAFAAFPTRLLSKFSKDPEVVLSIAPIRSSDHPSGPSEFFVRGQPQLIRITGRSKGHGSEYWLLGFHVARMEDGQTRRLPAALCLRKTAWGRLSSLRHATHFSRAILHQSSLFPQYGSWTVEVTVRPGSLRGFRNLIPEDRGTRERPSHTPPFAYEHAPLLKAG